jgi:2-(1,2-epoxy-1,2-dihydrophenyl)acetyl-CoA isomerase
VTGNGRAFCSGDDISGHKDRGQPRRGESPTTPIGLHHRQQALVRAVMDCPKPTVAMLNGYAHGMGSDIALACDFRYAASDAVLGDIRMSRGMPPGSGATWLLPRIVGLTRATELIFTGDALSGTDAERIGLVNRAVPREDLLPVTMAFAARLAAGPTKSIAIAKDAIHRQLTMTLAEAHRDSLVYAEAGWRPVDEVEGVNSFNERRPPRFTGQ